ncbi:DUF2577 domain-containing protein [Mycobacterium gordonae]|nr:DUF2577 domain-containing protein [Mycobacterium gordonae]
MSELEDGGTASKWRNLIRRVGKNTDVLIEFATVTSAEPLRIQVDNMRIELEAEDVVIPESLTDYEYEAQIDGGPPVTIAVKGALKVDDRVIVAQINDGQTYVIFDRIGGTA